MKKMLLSLVAVLLLASAAQAALVQGNPIDFTISAMVGPSLLLEGNNDLMYFGSAGYGVDSFSNDSQGFPRTTVQNISVNEVDLTASATVESTTPADPDWTLVDRTGHIDDNADDTALLAGIFTYWADLVTEPGTGIDMAYAKFQDNDILDGTPVVASTTDFFDEVTPDPLVHNGADLPGYNVAIGGYRSMRFMLQYPTAGTTTSNVAQTIHVFIGCQL